MNEHPDNLPKATGVRRVTVDERSDGQRIDNFLLRELGATSGHVPRTLIYRKLRKGEVRINGKRAKPNTRLSIGDEVRIPPVQTTAGEHQAPHIPEGWLKRAATLIIQEDDTLLVVNKPAGLAVHGGSQIPFGLIDLLRAHYPDEPMLELVHRIDRETSGLVLLARNLPALRELQSQFRPQGTASKRYELVVHGRWPARLATIDVPLLKLQGSGGDHRVVADPQGKQAVTHFSILNTTDQASLLQARLETGRTHQIRVHAAESGHPLVGDDKYGDRQRDRQLVPDHRPGLMLHAARLTIHHPVTGVIQHYRAPRPEHWAPLLKNLNLETDQ